MLTADGFGESSSANSTMLDLLAAGYISSLGVMPVAPASAEGIEQLRTVGMTDRCQLHFCATSPIVGNGRWRPIAKDVPSLVSEDGALPALGQIVEINAKNQDLRSELIAQWQWLVDQDIQPTALSTHRDLGYGQFGRAWLAQLLDFAADMGASFRLAKQKSAVSRQFDGWSEATELAESFDVIIPDVVLTPQRSLPYPDYADFLAHCLTLLATAPDGSDVEFHLHVGTGSEPLATWSSKLLRDPIFHDATSRFLVVSSW